MRRSTLRHKALNWVLLEMRRTIVSKANKRQDLSATTNYASLYKDHKEICDNCIWVHVLNACIASRKFARARRETRKQYVELEFYATCQSLRDNFQNHITLWLICVWKPQLCTRWECGEAVVCAKWTLHAGMCAVISRESSWRGGGSSVGEMCLCVLFLGSEKRCFRGVLFKIPQRNI